MDARSWTRRRTTWSWRTRRGGTAAPSARCLRSIHLHGRSGATRFTAGIDEGACRYSRDRRRAEAVRELVVAAAYDHTVVRITTFVLGSKLVWRGFQLNHGGGNA